MNGNNSTRGTLHRQVGTRKASCWQSVKCELNARARGGLTD